MRNSFSLLVHFQLVNKSVGSIIFFNTASNMRLIPFLLLILSTTINVETNDRYNFPPQFNRNEGYSSESSHYLPAESHTSIPYIPAKPMSNLPYSYLPATGTKPPMRFPSPYPLIISTTMMPFDEDEEHEHQKTSRPINPPQPPNHLPQIQRNQTERSLNHRMDNRNVPKPTYNPIERIDSKAPMGFAHNVQNATPRNFIIASETKRSDAIDQFKFPGYPGTQFLPAPGLHNVYVSATTEPAIPILRLSNEMDLDGSFSYEALGADQTHYVQHSHMENMGTDKEEQVVEGSYSYVGDNGQTYTVNYIADSNGFRASGDHLPVAPPIPEIIQRSVQYNLAEEAKKPPHLKSWQYDENEGDENQERFLRYVSPSPPKTLFTGKAPESFSFAFQQGQQTPPNNLAPSASSQVQIKTKVEQKMNNNVIPISPQVTFAASQGTRTPSVNSQQMGNMFANERPMPQLVNYDASSDPDENNKGLWRWQYGLNANNIQHQTSEKNSISRSSGEGDDVILNFQDMTPEQYQNAIKKDILPPERFQKDVNFQDKDNAASEPLTSSTDIPVFTTYKSKPYWVVSNNKSEAWYQSGEEPDNYINDYYYKPMIIREKFTSAEPSSTSRTPPRTPSPRTEVTAKEESTEEFQDFIINDKMLQQGTSEEPTTMKQPTTTEDISYQTLNNNIFLRNILNIDGTRHELNDRNKIKEDASKFLPKIVSEPKIKSKYMRVMSNPFLSIQGIKKPLDASEILNLITVRNHFESAKTKPTKYKIGQKQMFPPTFEEYEVSTSDPRANFKNYKVMQRARTDSVDEVNIDQLRDEFISPGLKRLHSNLPPLGRAGPTLKSYLPPIFI